MLFNEVVATSRSVGATSSRLAKSQGLADLLVRVEPGEIEAAVGFLIGEPRQGRVGIGWKTLQAAANDQQRADQQLVGEPSLTVTEVDTAITTLASLTGPGSGTARIELLAGLFRQLSAEEATFLTRLLGGELRQGALAGVMRASQVGGR